MIGEEHYGTARDVQATLQRYKELQDIIAILGMDELSEDDKLAVPARARSSASCRSRSSWPRCSPARRASTCRSRTPSAASGASSTANTTACPEQAFYMVGSIDEVAEKAKTLCNGHDHPRRYRQRRKEIYSGAAEMVFAPAGDRRGRHPAAARAAADALKPGEVRVRSGSRGAVVLRLRRPAGSAAARGDGAGRHGAARPDLDEAAALKAKERAEEALRNRKTDIDYAKAQAELAEAVAQLRAIQKLRDRTRK